MATLTIGLTDEKHNRLKELDQVKGISVNIHLVVKQCVTIAALSTLVDGKKTARDRRQGCESQTNKKLG